MYKTSRPDKGTSVRETDQGMNSEHLDTIRKHTTDWMGWRHDQNKDTCRETKHERNTCDTLNRTT